MKKSKPSPTIELLKFLVSPIKYLRRHGVLKDKKPKLEWQNRFEGKASPSKFWFREIYFFSSCILFLYTLKEYFVNVLHPEYSGLSFYVWGIVAYFLGRLVLNPWIRKDDPI